MSGPRQILPVEVERDEMWKFLTAAGLTGAVVSAICCFTPFLPWVLGALGMSGAVGYIYRDDVLLPILAVSLIVAGVGFWLGRRAQ